MTEAGRRSVEAVIRDARSRGIRLWTEGRSLRYRAPGGGLPPDLRERIASLREEAVETLRAEAAADVQSALDHRCDASLVEAVEGTESGGIDAQRFWRLGAAFHDDADSGILAQVVRVEKRVGYTGRDDFHVAGAREVVEREVA